MKIWDRHDRIVEIYGTIIGLGLIVYFFIMYGAGLIHVIELRLLNLLIMLAGVYYALKQYRRTHDGRLNYFRALVIGNAASTLGTSIFCLFLFLYLKIDVNLMQSIQQNEPLGMHLNPYMATATVFGEGIFSGFMCTFLLTNYIVTDQVNEPIDIDKAKSQG